MAKTLSFQCWPSVARPATVKLDLNVATAMLSVVLLGVFNGTVRHWTTNISVAG